MRFELPLNLGVDELPKLKREDALRLASSTDEWRQLFGDKTYEHVFLEVVPHQRADLHVQCKALKKSKKGAKSVTNAAAQDSDVHNNGDGH